MELLADAGLPNRSPEHEVLWSMWTWEAMTNLTYRNKEQTWICTVHRSDAAHWDMSVCNLTSWVSSNFRQALSLSLNFKGFSGKDICFVFFLSFFKTSGPIKYEWNTNQRWTPGCCLEFTVWLKLWTPKPGVTSKDQWCSQLCLLLDWQASCYVHLVCV